MTTVISRVVLDALIIATVLFTAAGTLVWPRAWTLLVVLLIVRLTTAVAVFRVNPDLLRERALTLVHRDQPRSDTVVLLAFMATAFVGVPAVAALDIHRWHILPVPTSALAALGLALFALGWFIKGLALRRNAFAVTAVRLQTDRQHALVDSGVYNVVRHPMYAGNPLVNVGLSLWLGSYIAALGAIIPLGLLVMRIALEERFLSRELPGYPEYMSRVPYRMLPGIW